MNRLLPVLCLLLFCTTSVCAQESETPSEKPLLRPATIGVGVIFTDFTTARSLRNGSLVSAINNDEIASLGDMAAGAAVTYAKGLLPHLDFAATLGYTSGRVVLQNKPDQITKQGFLSLDASFQGKMLPDNFRLIPYVSAGVGASVSNGYFGAMMPLGVGLRLRVSEKLSLGLQSQYRLAITETAGYHFMHGLNIMGSL